MKNIVLDNENLVPFSMFIKKKRMRYGDLVITGKCLVDDQVTTLNLMTNLVEIKSLWLFEFTDNTMMSDNFDGSNWSDIHWLLET